MSRLSPTSLCMPAVIGTAMLCAWPASAQKPEKPLSGLLEGIPTPEDGAEPTPEVESELPIPVAPPRPPVVVRPGTVVAVDLPPSTIEAPPAAPDYDDAVSEDLLPDSEAEPVEEAEAEVGADKPTLDDEEVEEAADDEAVAAAAAAAAADAEWAAMQERRRQEINAQESPIVDRLNAGVAARAAAETRRIEEERAAYERSLVEAEAEALRSRAEHEAAMAEHARRVQREQAEYRARVEACLDGDRRACRPDK